MPKSPAIAMRTITPALFALLLVCTSCTQYPDTLDPRPSRIEDSWRGLVNQPHRYNPIDLDTIRDQDEEIREARAEGRSWLPPDLR